MGSDNEMALKLKLLNNNSKMKYMVKLIYFGCTNGPSHQSKIIGPSPIKVYFMYLNKFKMFDCKSTETFVVKGVQVKVIGVKKYDQN